MNQIFLAFRAFFALLFSGQLNPELLGDLGLAKKQAPKPEKPAPPPPPQLKPADGALQLLGLLQRDARILDFFMEDIAPYTDDQVGAAAREVHDKTREVLIRNFAPTPVIDAVEGTPIPASTNPNVKYIGNVPATGKPGSGILRHKGWKATTTNLPQITNNQSLAVLAPAEIEIE